jgi:hypothetical protein
MNTYTCRLIRRVLGDARWSGELTYFWSVEGILAFSVIQRSCDDKDVADKHEGLTTQEHVKLDRLFNQLQKYKLITDYKQCTDQAENTSRQDLTGGRVV